jgi:DNA-binding transcriptional ArsR family regulator
LVQPDLSEEEAMDSAISTAARALSVGDALSALKLVALRSDPQALALRGIAMAQLGDFAVARQLLQRAVRALNGVDVLAWARSVVAEAEVALALRALGQRPRELLRAAQTLARRGDAANALFARLVVVRRQVLLGDLEQAQRSLATLPLAGAPARLAAIAALVAADVAMRQGLGTVARQALSSAHDSAKSSGIRQLVGEVERAQAKLRAPAARVLLAGKERALSLEDLELQLASSAFVVDACRRRACLGKKVVTLVSRPVLLALLVALAEAAPAEASRETLIARAFGAKRVSESHRARLRVEVGRLRRLLAGMTDITATTAGFRLDVRAGLPTLLLLPPGAGDASELLALLAGGDSWSTSGLAAAVGKSQRSVQRALATLQADGRVIALGRGRSQRWSLAPQTGFATTLLLVARGTLG